MRVGRLWVVFSVLLVVSISVLSFQNCSRGLPIKGYFSSLIDEGPDPYDDYGLQERVIVAGLNLPTQLATGTVSYSLTPVFAGVSFNRPLFVASPPDSTGRLFVVEKGGKIKVVLESNPGATTAATFLDISSGVQTAGEQGLLGLAFDPNYAVTKEFYVFYSKTGFTRISRFKASNDPNVADTLETPILDVTQTPYDNHKGGMLAFGPDGYLYASLGDGGSQGDPDNRAQDTKQLLGKVLRLNVRGQPRYAIPADNPFVGGPDCGSANNVGNAHPQNCPEIYAYGFRNPWRFSFDGSTIWLADVGGGSWEEIDIVTKGGNYGWRIYKGSHNHNVPSNPPTTIMPVYEYSHSVGYSITGGYVYHGASAPNLAGKYVYGDFSGKIWALTLNPTNNQLLSTLPSTPAGIGIASFGVGTTGELYVVAMNPSNGVGALFKVSETVPYPIPPFYPLKLSKTGIFTDVASLTVRPGVIPYSVNAPLWSDNAGKDRWIILPGKEQIKFSPTGNWEFPVGTVFVKHFEVPTSANTRKRLETRLLIYETGGWKGYTYIWNAAGTDADIFAGDSSTTQSYTVTLPDGSSEVRTWEFPSRTDCMRCHAANQGYVLGARTRQINRFHRYGNIADNQLRSWNHIGLFTSEIPESSTLEAYPKYTDTGGSLERKARTYLHVNCAGCHYPGSPTSTEADIDFSFDATLSQMKVIDVVPTGNTYGLMNPARIRSGSRNSSLVFERMKRPTDGRMPPLSTRVVDQEGLSLIGSWIDSL